MVLDTCSFVTKVQASSDSAHKPLLKTLKLINQIFFKKNRPNITRAVTIWQERVG